MSLGIQGRHPSPEPAHYFSNRLKGPVLCGRKILGIEPELLDVILPLGLSPAV